MKQTPKIIGAIIGIIFFIALISGFTYAWFTWISPTINVSGNTTCFDINYVEGNIVTDDLLLIDANKLITGDQITIKKGMAVTYLNASKNSKCTRLNAKLVIELESNIPNTYYTSGSNENALNYAIVSYDPIAITDVSSTTLDGESFSILKTGAITASGSSTIYESSLANDGTATNYLIIFYLDGNKINGDINNQLINIDIKAWAVQTN